MGFHRSYFSHCLSLCELSEDASNPCKPFSNFCLLKLWFFCSNVAKYAAETNMHNTSEGGIGAGAAAGVTIGVTAFVGLLIAAMMVGWRRYKSLNRKHSESTEPLNSAVGDYGAISNEQTSNV